MTTDALNGQFSTYRPEGRQPCISPHEASSIMPLPDERPRQSVANLIGRFEKQKSSASSSAPPITFPRTSSVTSHRTGDSSQEEIKEKREWPPKTADTLSTVPVPIQLSEKRLSPAPLSPLANKERPSLKESEVPSVPVTVTPVSPSDKHSSPAIATLPSPSQTTPAKAKSPPPSQMKPTSTRTTVSVRSPAPKAVTHVTEASHPQSSGASAPSGSTVKPQHAGQSITSTHTATRIATKPRASAPPKTPTVTTPARSRTPISTRPKTPSSVPRVKTPSGLYAPTAASLARSKAGPPPPPPPEKPKRKITTDLSKPTAASASRMRSAAPAAVAKVGKASAVKPTTTKAAAKPAAKPTVTKSSTPSKRHVATKSQPHETTDDNNNKVKSSTEHTPAIKVSAIEPTATAVTAIPRESDDISQKNDLHDLHADIHPAAARDDSLVEEEYLEDEEQLEHDEIENYDDDFPDDIPPELIEEHDNNGHALTAGVDNESMVEDPEYDHLTQPASTLHDEPISTLGADHIELEKIGADESEYTPESHEIAPRLHHSEDIPREEALGMTKGVPKEVVNSSKVGSDLEDIVNLLEASPRFQMPSEELPPAGNVVPEAGEIPDEY